MHIIKIHRHIKYTHKHGNITVATKHFMASLHKQ